MRFEGAIDIIAQTPGGLASLTWDHFRMVITVASDDCMTLESLATKEFSDHLNDSTIIKSR